MKTLGWFILTTTIVALFILCVRDIGLLYAFVVFSPLILSGALLLILSNDS